MTTIAINGLPLINGTEAFVHAIVDTDQGLKAMAPNIANRARYVNKANNSLFSLAELNAGSGTFALDSPGVYTWFIPSMINLSGYVYDNASALLIPVIVKSTGSLFLNGCQCRSALGGGTQSQMLGGAGWNPGDTFIIGSTIYTLGTGAISNLSSWVGQAVPAYLDPATYTGVTILDPQELSINYAVQGQSGLLAAIGFDLWAWI